MTPVRQYGQRSVKLLFLPTSPFMLFKNRKVAGKGGQYEIHRAQVSYISYFTPENAYLWQEFKYIS